MPGQSTDQATDHSTDSPGPDQFWTSVGALQTDVTEYISATLKIVAMESRRNALILVLLCVGGLLIGALLATVWIVCMALIVLGLQHLGSPLWLALVLTALLSLAAALLVARGVLWVSRKIHFQASRQQVHPLQHSSEAS